MRFDKLTTKFQQALADAQSKALANDNGFIEPQHLLAAMLEQDDGGTASLLSRAGVAVPRLKQALGNAIDRLPKVEGQGGEIRVSRDLNNLLNLADKEASKRGDQFIASELFLLALADDKGETGRAAEGCRAHPEGAAEAAIETRPRRRGRRLAGSRGPARGAARNTRSTSPSAPATASSIR